MNRRKEGLTISQAIDGFVNTKSLRASASERSNPTLTISVDSKTALTIIQLPVYLHPMWKISLIGYALIIGPNDCMGSRSPYLTSGPR